MVELMGKLQGRGAGLPPPVQHRKRGMHDIHKASHAACKNCRLPKPTKGDGEEWGEPPPGSLVAPPTALMVAGQEASAGLPHASRRIVIHERLAD